MPRVFLIAVVALVILLGVGVLALGLFPPGPRVQAVEHVVPNDHFAPQ